MDKDLKNKMPAELEAIVEELGGKKYLAKYIFTFIHSKNVCEISGLSTLSKLFREALTKNGYYISSIKTVEVFTDPDGTEKYLFELPDGCRIETVVLCDGKRRTLCVSTQVGCVMNCTFCATAKLKFQRNLTSAEIADQVNVVEKDTGKINNVVYMGMGEPLQNYDAVLKSVRILNNPNGRNIGLRHLAISTCGKCEEIRKLANEDIHPRLAISLNAATDELRTKLMPINKAEPLAKLISAVRAYQLVTRLRVTFEYVLIKGVNDSKLNAEKLVKLADKIKCNINLIEYNPHSGCKFVASSKETIRGFAKILTAAGIETTIRLKMGHKIKAACGQLGATLLNRNSGKQKKSNQN